LFLNWLQFTTISHNSQPCFKKTRNLIVKILKISACLIVLIMQKGQ